MGVPPEGTGGERDADGRHLTGGTTQGSSERAPKGRGGRRENTAEIGETRERGGPGRPGRGTPGGGSRGWGRAALRGPRAAISRVCRWRFALSAGREIAAGSPALGWLVPCSLFT